MCKLALMICAGILILSNAHAEQKVTVETLIHSLDPRQQSSVNPVGQRRNFKVEAILAEQEDVQPAMIPQVDLSISFNVNQATLTPDGLSMVDTIAQALKSSQLNHYRFMIEGHTDKSGHYDYNKKLSQQRAESVKQELIKRGIPINRLVAIGKAWDEPIDIMNPHDEKNRRVKLVLLMN